MRLLLKWLRPERVPSPNRKKIPFGTRLRLSLYRGCLKTLRKWYSRYAFSDTVFISGSPVIRVYHEFRDLAFEAEIKRMRLPMTEMMIERRDSSSSQPANNRRRPYFKHFQFEDSLLLEINGQKVSIKHGLGRSFVSTIKGQLKESGISGLIAKYAFSGSKREQKSETAQMKSELSFAETTKPSLGHTVYPPKKGSSSLFGDDPLLVNNAQKTASTISSPTIKSVEGVIIDESF